ncbi:MAG: aminoacyl-tRNA hydrolase [candidate division WOR-3 bacterium]
MKALVGLGNPGPLYSFTRHNMGHLLVELYASRNSVKLSPGKGEFLTGLKGDLWLVKTTCYMNISGRAVKQFLDETGLAPTDILVAYDDAALPFGKIRLRPGGSHGGHHGIESVIYCLGTKDIPRLRMGIGPVPEGMALRDFVLSRFTEREKKALQRFLESATRCVDAWLDDPERAPGRCGEYSLEIMPGDL